MNDAILVNTLEKIAVTWIFQRTEELAEVSQYLAIALVGTTIGDRAGILSKRITKSLMKEIYKLNFGDQIHIEVISSCPLELLLKTMN